MSKAHLNHSISMLYRDCSSIRSAFNYSLSRALGPIIYYGSFIPMWSSTNGSWLEIGGRKWATMNFQTQKKKKKWYKAIIILYTRNRTCSDRQIRTRRKTVAFVIAQRKKRGNPFNLIKKIKFFFLLTRRSRQICYHNVGHEEKVEGL